MNFILGNEINMDLNRKHIQSDSCTYSRKLRHAFKNVNFSNKGRQQYHKNYKLIKTGTIGLISCIVLFSFALVQYSFLQNLQCPSDEEIDEQVNYLQSPAGYKPEDVTIPTCDCDNFTIISQTPSKKKISSSNRVHGIRDIRAATTTTSTTDENYSVKKQLKISESIWERSVAQRHAWIYDIARNNLSSVNPWDGDNYVFFWNYFSPSFNCPHSVQRVGFIGDGGKWVCGLELYENESQKERRNVEFEAKETTTTPKPSCIIYSFGVANESSFEAEMLSKTECRIFAYDYSVKSIGSPVEPTNPRVTFKALGIGNKNLGKHRTLKYFMDQNGHDWIDILKMDIEGGEYAVLDKIMQDFPDEYDNDNKESEQQQKQKTPLPFGQLLIEVHVDGKIFPKFYEWWEQLEARGLRAYFTEVNHVACALSMVKPNYVEYSFINIRGNHRLLQR